MDAPEHTGRRGLQPLTLRDFAKHQGKHLGREAILLGPISLTANTLAWGAVRGVARRPYRYGRGLRRTYTAFVAVDVLMATTGLALVTRAASRQNVPWMLMWEAMAVHKLHVEHRAEFPSWDLAELEQKVAVARAASRLAKAMLDLLVPMERELGPLTRP